MTYFEGFIVPVPESGTQAFVRHAMDLAPHLKQCGVRRQVEGWGNDIPEGTLTDFRKAVSAAPGETAVFAWFEYQDRQERDTANQRMIGNSTMMEMSTHVPFDAKRMILGGFDAVVEEGSPGGRYVDGIVVPVPAKNREDYVRLAAKNAKVFREFGAMRIVEAIGDDVPHGQATDFYRAVRAEPEERVAFSFIEWPNKAKRDEGWHKIMQDDRMQHGAGLFDGKRMFWGGFDVLIDTARAEQTATVPVSA